MPVKKEPTEDDGSSGREQQQGPQVSGGEDHGGSEENATVSSETGGPLRRGPEADVGHERGRQVHGEHQGRRRQDSPKIQELARCCGGAHFFTEKRVR